MFNYPAHSSPALPTSSRPEHNRAVSDYSLNGSPKHPAPSGIPPILTPTLEQSQAHGSVPSSISIDPTSSTSDVTADDSHPLHLEQLPIVECQVRARIPTTINGSDMFLHCYSNNVDNKEHLAIVFGPNIRSKSLDAPRPGETERDRMIRGAYTGRLFPGRTSSRVDQLKAEAGVPTKTTEGAPVEPAADSPLVRIHSECLTGEITWSSRCDCGEQLDSAGTLMTEAGEGVIIYLRQEGRGIGLLEKMRAYNAIDLGADTYQANIELNHPADARTYGLATSILQDLDLGGQRGIRLLTNNPDKVRAVEGPNREVRVVQRVAMIPQYWKTGGKEGVHGEELDKYISTKIEKFKHMFNAS